MGESLTCWACRLRSRVTLSWPGHLTRPTSIPRDTTGPGITGPGPITRTATSSNGATVVYSVSASDPDDAVASLTCVPPSGSTFPIGTTTVTCTAADTHGNTNSANFTVHVL